MYICKSVIDSHKLILIRAAAESPQWREMSLNWMRLLYRTALKESESLKIKIPLNVARLEQYNAWIAAKTYCSFIPALFDEMGENLYE